MADTFDDSVNDCKSALKNDLNSTLHGNVTHDGTTHSDCISAPAAKAIFIITFTVELLVMLCMSLFPPVRRVFVTDRSRSPYPAIKTIDGTIIVHRYKSQLDDDHLWDKRHDVASGTKTHFKSAPVPESHPLSAQYHTHEPAGGPTSAYHPVSTGDFPSYPYIAPSNSYGRTDA